jgi:hypothetical protein
VTVEGDGAVCESGSDSGEGSDEESATDSEDESETDEESEEEAEEAFAPQGSAARVEVGTQFCRTLVRNLSGITR